MTFQVAGKVLDFYDDLYQEGIEKFASMDIDKSIKNTELLEVNELEKLADADFGLVFITKKGNKIRKFPVHDAGNTWISGQYFDMNRKVMPKLAQEKTAYHINKAAVKHKTPVAETIKKLASGKAFNDNYYMENNNHEIIVEQEKAPENIESWALDNGNDMRKYAMPTADHVRLAATYFNKYAHRYEPKTRSTLAKAIYNRSQELKVDIAHHPSIQKYASSSYNIRLKDYLDYRKQHLLDNERGKQVLDKMAELIHKVPVDEFADALSKFDEKTGLDKHYESGMPDAYESTYDVVKTAGLDAYSSQVDDYTITGKELAGVAMAETLLEYFGRSFVKSFKRDPVPIFESLPKPTKIIVIKISKGEM